MAKVNRGDLKGNVKSIQKRIDKLIEKAPHKIDGKLLVEGMKKEGVQTHVHIIVSRKDVTNTYSLSPGAKFKENTTILNGKEEKQGFIGMVFLKLLKKGSIKYLGMIEILLRGMAIKNCTG